MKERQKDKQKNFRLREITKRQREIKKDRSRNKLQIKDMKQK